MMSTQKKILREMQQMAKVLDGRDDKRLGTDCYPVGHIAVMANTGSLSWPSRIPTFYDSFLHLITPLGLRKQTRAVLKQRQSLAAGHWQSKSAQQSHTHTYIYDTYTFFPCHRLPLGWDLTQMLCSWWAKLGFTPSLHSSFLVVVVDTVIHVIRYAKHVLDLLSLPLL